MRRSDVAPLVLAMKTGKLGNGNSTFNFRCIINPYSGKSRLLLTYIMNSSVLKKVFPLEVRLVAARKETLYHLLGVEDVICRRHWRPLPRNYHINSDGNSGRTGATLGRHPKASAQRRPARR